MAAEKIIKIDQGTSVVLEFKHYTTILSTKSIKDLTGYTAKFWIAKSISGPVIKDYSTKITYDAINGKIILSLDPIDTSSVHFTGSQLNAVFALEISNGAQTFRTFEGQFIIKKEIINI